MRSGSRANDMRHDGADLLAVEHDAAGGLVEQPHHHHRGGRLAAAGFADEADALAVADREADAVDGAEHLLLDRRLAAEQFAAARRSAPWRGYSFTSFSTRSSGFSAASACAAVGAATGFAAAASSSGNRSRRFTPSRGVARISFLRVGVRGPGEDVGGLRGLDHLALLHHDHAVAIGGGEAEIVRDQDRRHAALARQLDDQIHHRLLRRDVEAGGRLVGDQELRIAGQRQRDDHALAHAAGQLERIGVVALARAGDLDLLQRLDRLFAAIGDLRLLHVLAQHVLDLVADLADRVQRHARVLEDHRDFAAAQVAHLGFAGAP